MKNYKNKESWSTNCFYVYSLIVLVFILKLGKN